ncbi:MAG: hypothetical protein V4819_22070 [Verrucomicrobiota bacterium]
MGRLFLAMGRRGFTMDRMSFSCCFVPAGGVTFAKLLGAVGAVELMTFAGNGKHGNGHKKDGE